MNSLGSLIDLAAKWDWGDMITAVVALYGAVLSTYNLLAERRARLPQVKVRVYIGNVTHQDGSLSEDMVLLEAANVGLCSVTLGSHGLRLSGGQAVISPRPEGDAHFPHELLPGRSCTIWMRARDVAAEAGKFGYTGRVRVIGEYDSQTGQAFKSEPFELPVEGWI